MLQEHDPLQLPVCNLTCVGVHLVKLEEVFTMSTPMVIYFNWTLRFAREDVNVFPSGHFDAVGT